MLFKVFTRIDSTAIIVVLMNLVLVPSLLQCVGVARKLKSFLCGRSGTFRKLLLYLFPLLPFLLQAGGLGYLTYHLPNLYPHVKTETQLLLVIGTIMKSAVYWENFFPFRRQKVPSANTTTDDTTSDTNSTTGNEQNTKLKEKKHYKDLIRAGVRVLLAVVLIVLFSTHGSFPFDTSEKEHHHGLTTQGQLLTKPNTTIVRTVPAEPLTTQTPAVVTEDSNSNYTDGTNTTPSTNATPSTTARPLKHIIILQDDSGFWAWLENLFYDHYLLLFLLGSSFLLTYFAELACRLHMQRLAFTLPLLLIPWIAWAITYHACFNETIVTIFDAMGIMTKCSVGGTMDINKLVGVSVVLWLSSILATWYLWTPKVERMAKPER